MIMNDDTYVGVLFARRERGIHTIRLRQWTADGRVRTRLKGKTTQYSLHDINTICKEFSTMDDVHVVGKLIPPQRYKNPYLWEILCPFCGNIHTHGAGNDGTFDGHRASHCSYISSGYFINKE